MWHDLSCRLLDIVHADQKLYLVFEFLDVDLKRYMENGNKAGKPITLDIVKVSATSFHLPFRVTTCLFWLPTSLRTWLTRAEEVRRVETRPELRQTLPSSSASPIT